MRKILNTSAIILMNLLVSQIFAQKIPLHSLTSGAGSSFASTNIKLDISLGQLATSTFIGNSSHKLTQGFQQANHFAITEINIVQLHGFNLYPNPAKDYIICENSKFEKKYNWTILNQLGQILNQGVIERNIEQIDISNLPTGNYNFYIQSSKNEFGNIKFIKSE
jgi:hypothetical protein